MEYYSAIKKNTFESVLMRWMKLEPITQSEVSQKEKHQYSMWSEVTQSCPTLCNPIDCSPPGLSIHGIFQARVVEWVAISFSIAGRCFTLWVTREALLSLVIKQECLLSQLLFYIDLEVLTNIRG